VKRNWPATRAEYDDLEAIAYAKYRPLVMALQPYELTGLVKATGEAVDAIKPEFEAEERRRGYRPPGARIGR
jgi:hypothetical protein